ncbi:MAG: hypothetical protein ACR2HX_23720 [Pyrinomonadaceae bacterium]
MLTWRELRDSEYARQIERHGSTINDILDAHAAEVRKLTFSLRSAHQTNLRFTPAAQAIEASSQGAGAQLPTPIIPHEKLNELQVKAIRSRDVDAFEQLEQIRREMPHELGGPDRDTFSFARLKGQTIVAQSNVAIAEKRVADFEKSRHFAKFEIDGEQWSLTRVDRQQRLAEREIEFHRGTISAYRKRLYAALQNPIKLYGLGEYKERATIAKENMASAREKIRDLQPIRAEVKRPMEDHAAELNENLHGESRITQALNRAVGQETGLRLARGQELPGAEFNGSELKRLEETAITLRDPHMLLTTQRGMEAHYGQTEAGREKLAARAIGRVESADVSLQELAERIQRFPENREYFPVLFKGTDGQELTLSPDFYESPDTVVQIAGRISTAYRSLYGELHQKRTTDFLNAIEEVKGRSDWSLVPENVRDSVLSPLTQRACESLDLPDNSTRCQNCHSTIGEMESDLAAINGLNAQVIARVQELTTPPEREGVRTERVRLADFFVGPLDSEVAVREAVERLSDYLLKLTAENVRIIVE